MPALPNFPNPCSVGQSYSLTFVCTGNGEGVLTWAPDTQPLGSSPDPLKIKLTPDGPRVDNFGPPVDWKPPVFSGILGGNAADLLKPPGKPCSGCGGDPWFAPETVAGVAPVPAGMNYPAIMGIIADAHAKLNRDDFWKLVELLILLFLKK